MLPIVASATPAGLTAALVSPLDAITTDTVSAHLSSVRGPAATDAPVPIHKQV